MNAPDWMIRPAVLFAVVAAGCGRSADPPPTALTLPPADTLVSAASDLLATPFDIAVDADGAVYVLDYGYHRVLVLPPDGGAPRTIGAPGSGPGEFKGPSALTVGNDSIRVLDRGNGRVQVLTAAGEYVRSFTLGETNAGGEAAMLPSGVIALGTYGMGSDHLIALLGPDGRLGAGIGALPVPGATTWDFAEMKSQIGAGRIPAALRNRARPVLGRYGGLWAVHLSEPRVARYDQEGRQLWERDYSDPTAAAIRGTFFEKNRSDPRPFAFFPLTLVADAVAHGEMLYLLLNTGEEAPATVLVMDGSGRLVARFSADDVRGARQIAIDAEGRRLYVSTSGAELLRVDLPEMG